MRLNTGSPRGARRAALRCRLLAALASACAACGQSAAPIAQENLKPGTAQFGLRDDRTHDKVEAYADRLSVMAGERVGVHAALHAGGHEEAGAITWGLFRLGNYSSHGARRVGGGGPVALAAQRPCPIDLATGRVACAWDTAFELSTAGLVRGVYLLRLSAADGSDSYLPLVVRDGRPAEVVMVVPTTTWQAYNQWGGAGLYGDKTGKTRFGIAVRVSYDRPFEFGGPGALLDHDQHLVQWLEAAGLEAAYYTSEDVDRDPALLSRARVVVFSAHDEYWTRRQRDGAEAALAAGTSLVLLGANAGYWQIRMDAAPDGRERREITCYKANAPAYDPVGPQSPDLTVRFREVGRPEGRLFGVQYEDGWAYTSFPQAAVAPEHWAFAGTGLKKGDPIFGLGGSEVDQVFTGEGHPEGVVTLGEAHLVGALGTPAPGQMAVRQQGKALVFASGGIGLVRTLGASGLGQQASSQILANVMGRALGRAVKAPGPPGRLSQVVDGGWASSVKTFAGTQGKRGAADGPAGTGTLTSPLALAALPSGGLVVADAGTGTLRLVSASGALSTLPLDPPPGRVLGVAADGDGNVYYTDLYGHAVLRVDPAGARTLFAGVRGPNGAPVQGDHDGPAAEATFSRPAGVSLSKDGGALYVVDLGSGRLRRIDLRAAGNPVTTLAKGLGTPTSAAPLDGSAVAVWDQAQFRLFSVDPLRPPPAAPIRGGAGPVPGFDAAPVILIGGEGMHDGLAHEARLRANFGLAALPDGSLLIADGGNGRVRRFVDGHLETLAGSGRAGGRDGKGSDADLDAPSGLAVGADGRIYLAETGAGLIRVIER